MSAVARLDAEIVVSKNSAMNTKAVKEALKEMQNVADGTEINVTYKGDASNIEKTLPELKKQLSKLSDNVKINIDLSNIKGSTDELEAFRDNVTQIFKELSKGSKLSFGGFDADTSIKEIDKQLDNLRKQLTATTNEIKGFSSSQKDIEKLGNNLNDFDKKIRNIYDSLKTLEPGSDSYKTALTNFVLYINRYKELGGEIDKLNTTTKRKSGISDLFESSSNIVDFKHVEKQKQLISDLTNQIDELEKKKREINLSQSGSKTISVSETNNQEIEKLNKELEEQKQKTIEVNEQLEKQRNLYKELESKNSELQNQLNNSVGTEAYKELEKTLAQVTAQMEEALQKASELEAELGANFSFSKHLAQKIHELENGEVVPKSDYDTASKVVESKDKQIDKQREKLAKLEDETSELMQANEKLTESNNKLTAENVTLTDKIEEQKIALDTVNQQIKENEVTIESYRSAIESTSNALSECQEKLKQFSFDPFEQSLKQMGQFDDTKDMVHFDKAASYYGIYQEHGGQERAIVNEVDVTDRLIARYKELQQVHSMTTPEIIAKLNAINKETFALNEQREAIEKTIKALEKEEKTERAVAKAAEKSTTTKKTTAKSTSSVDDENKTKRANSLLAKIEAARKAQDAQTVSTEKTTQAQKEQTKAIEETGKVLKENQKTKETPSVSVDKLSQSFEEEKQIVERVIAAEKETLNELSQKITEVIVDVDRKTQAFKEEAQVVDGTVQSEINALATLSGWLLSLKDDVEKLSDSFSSISNVEVKIDTNIEDAFKDFDGEAIGKSLNGLNILKNLKPDKFDEQLTKMYVSLDDFAKSIKDLKIDDSNILSSIQKIVEKGEVVKALADALKSSKKSIDAAAKAVGSSDKKEKKADKKKADSQATDKNKDLAKVFKDAEKVAKDYYALLDKHKNNALSEKEQETWEKTNSAIKKAKESVEEYNKIMTEGSGSNKSRKSLEDAFTNYSNNSWKSYLGTFDQTVADAAKSLDKFNLNKRGLEYVEELKAKSFELENKLSEINGMKFNPVNEAEMQQQAQVIEKLKAEIIELQNALKEGINNKNFIKVSEEDVNRYIGKIEEILRKNTALTESKNGRKLIQDYQSLSKDFKLILDTGGSEVEIQKLINRFSELNIELQKSGKTGSSALETLGTKIKHLSLNFVATYLSLYDFIRYAREAYQSVAEIDKQMIELEKVSNMSGNRLQQSFEHASVAAKDLGSTISDVISATADWSRLGYDADDAEKLAEIATIYKNVGDGIDISTANESLISTLQGFKMEANEAMKIVDSFNEVKLCLLI